MFNFKNKNKNSHLLKLLNEVCDEIKEKPQFYKCFAESKEKEVKTAIIQSDDKLNAYCFVDYLNRVSINVTSALIKYIKDNNTPEKSKLYLQLLIGHEMAHLLHSHLKKASALKDIMHYVSIFIAGLFSGFFVMSSVNGEMSWVLSILLSGVSFLVSYFIRLLVIRGYSRYCEYEADLTAVKTIGGQEAITGMEELILIFATDRRKRLLEALLSTHPSAEQRISNIKSLKNTF